MAENNSSAPLKTAEGAISVTEVELTPEQRLGLISSCKGPLPGVAAQAPAAVAVTEALALLKKYRKLCVEKGRGDSYHLQRIDKAVAALAATPEIPATEYSSAGDLAEVQAEPVGLYVEARECSNCGHVGINDAADGKAACNTCDWQGDSPREDKCPDCNEVGTMTSACSECGARTSLIAAASLPVAAPQAQPADALDAAADLWYLQDTRSYVGNDVLWWAKDSNGYTTDISKAHAYTRDDAFRQAAMRGCDRAWPKAYIDGKTRPAVDMQYIDHQAAMAAAQEGGDAAKEA